LQHAQEITMPDPGKHLARSYDLTGKVTRLLRRRLDTAKERYTGRVREAYARNVEELMTRPIAAWDLWTQWVGYGVDAFQRALLTLDTLRQRGNNYVAHEQAGMPPVLHFDHETVMDGRSLERPVNYALLRIVPPEGVTVDPKRRPYIIIDPRAGHGPGIGGFKDDSQVGVALRDGHPVYFVIFFPDPEPGQTLLDVLAAEAAFVHKVRELHPDSAKPVIVGNCQGGWAAMMLVAANPDDTGPVVINGAPMSYWGGAWTEGEGDNPMRYSGGMLGGTWLASLTADLGNGVFDGAHLVQNFENLNPANTFWDKYYNLYANVDTEPPRFLEFERWWGGFYLMNREEIEWITQNLFVGNQLWSGAVRSGGEALDLRRIKSPIVVFASMGDNITPPQQAFNWVADIYGSTEEIKANGQVIVGLMHRDIGHLGIFVSGKVAKKEHTQIVSVLKSIESLPPGLYGMEINEAKGADGKPVYDVQFVEKRLEEVSERLNRLQRADEKPFEAVQAVSDFNQRAYELFAQPLVQSLSNDLTAKLGREFHPLRFQRWALSDLNPMLAWVAPAAEAVRAARQPLPADEPARRVERMAAELMSASLDYYRDVRDAATEAAFFQTYGSLFGIYLADRAGQREREQRRTDPRELPFVKQALARIDQGGYPEAVARVGALLKPRGEPIPLSRVELRKEMAEQYRELLPDLPPEQWRRVRGEQEIVVGYEPGGALATLPKLVSGAGERERLLRLVDAVVGDQRIQQLKPGPEQLEMLGRIREVLGSVPRAPAH
jgi:pimeloyl-ACP methyl ester carboxylesterase